jgi:hypothetical protein
LKSQIHTITLKDLAPECFPLSGVTDKLAGAIAKQAKALGSKEDERSFPEMNILDYLPPWAANWDLSDPHKEPDALTWITAYQNMALAAAACQVWPYHASMAHLRICMQIALAAKGEARGYGLAFLYHQLCRESWTEKARRGDAAFSIVKVSQTFDLEILEQARRRYDGPIPTRKHLAYDGAERYHQTPSRKGKHSDQKGVKGAGKNKSSHSFSKGNAKGEGKRPFPAHNEPRKTAR